MDATRNMNKKLVKKIRKFNNSFPLFPLFLHVLDKGRILKLFSNTQMKLKRPYRVGGSGGIGEKSGLGEIADIEGILVLENVEAVILLVLEN